MSDVAALAGVSMMTVSNIVNGKWNFATPETRRRVEDAVARLNYRPAADARRLRLRQSFSIGMVILDENPSFLTDPFISNVVAGLANHLGENRYSLMLHGVSPASFQSSSLFGSIQTDALCVLSSGPEKDRRAFVTHLEKLRQPLALIQEKSWRLRNACFIRQDDHGGARALADHLVAAGATSFLMIVPRLEWPAMSERVRGVREALQAARLDKRLTIVASDDESYDSAQAALKQALDGTSGRFDAVIGGNDNIAIAAMHLLKAKGFAIPADILVTGFNAFEASRYSEPRLTTVHSPAYDMGRCAGETLIERLRSGRFARRDITLPVELRLSESSHR